MQRLQIQRNRQKKERLLTKKLSFLNDLQVKTWTELVREKLTLRDAFVLRTEVKFNLFRCLSKQCLFAWLEVLHYGHVRGISEYLSSYHHENRVYCFLCLLREEGNVKISGRVFWNRFIIKFVVFICHTWVHCAWAWADKLKENCTSS